MNNSTFSTKNLVLSSVLLGVGFVLHAVTPPLFFGIKPDFLLACMFIAIIINPNFKNAVVTGCVAGLIAALTTGFPGGQIPSVIDKVLSALFVYFLFSYLKGFFKSSFAQTTFVSILTIVGTLFSGVVFLGSALAIFGLPAPFSALFVTVILPTCVANGFVSFLIYKVFSSIRSFA